MQQAHRYPLDRGSCSACQKIQEEMLILTKQGQLDPTSFRGLSEFTTLSPIILFNKRTAGEASQLTVEAFEQAKLANDDHFTNDKLLKSLSQLEKQQPKSSLLVEIRGKRGRKVPMLHPSKIFMCSFLVNYSWLL